MATPEMSLPVKRHSHPVLGGLSLAALVLSCVALAKSCPPVPAPAAAPAPVTEKPLAVAPVALPAPAASLPAPVEVKLADPVAPVDAAAPVSK